MYDWVNQSQAIIAVSMVSTLKITHGHILHDIEYVRDSISFRDIVSICLVF